MFSSNIKPNPAQKFTCLGVALLMLASLMSFTGHASVPHTLSSTPKVNGATGYPTGAQALATNGKIAFAGDVGSNYEIFTMNADGSGRTRLTDNPGVDYGPSWSPDGTRIAFFSERAGSFDIYLMNADGSSQRKLTNPSNNFGNSLAWSPDGRKIAFACNAICVINADGSNRTVISSNPGGFPSAWSPDGSQIAFTRYGSNYEIYTINADGSNPTRLTDSSIRAAAPAWSPDGSKLAFTKYIDCVAIPNGEVICFGAQIWVMNTDGSNQTFLTGGSIFSGAASSSQPAWSPDGTKIVYVATPGVANKSELFVMDAGGGNQTNITNTPDNDEAAPSWQPMGVTLPQPIDDPSFFVHQHYLDFLSREPDAGGLAYWTAQITQCGNDAACIHSRRIGISAAFFVELEFQETGYFVYRLYRAAYGTLPDAPSRANVLYSQFTTDRSRLHTGATLEADKQALASDFVNRPEFLATYPAGAPEDYVNHLVDTAGLVPYATERAQLVADMHAGKSRASVLRDVIELAEFRQREYNPSFVLMQYFGYLGRNPDQGGYDFWLNVLNNRVPNNYRAMVCAFITSTEYQLRFGPTITHSNSECES